VKTPVRRTARALLVTPEREVLLLRFAIRQIDRRYWITPGGAIEPGESPEGAVVRELAEETGLCVATVGPAVWKRSVPIEWATPRFVQEETYYWVPVARFEPSGAAIPTEAERREIEAYRWWALPEIAASRERFAPRQMAALLQQLFETGAPAAPIDTGI
jgi:8-oxo-dGTP pyrophosphatase MutT (NUDIX family)